MAIFAQLAEAVKIANGATPTTIVGAFIVVALSLVGLLAWILKHLFVTTIPGILESARKQRESNEQRMTEMAETQEKKMDLVCKTFKDEIAMERDVCAKNHVMLHADLIGISAAINASSLAATAAVKEHVTAAAQEYRHDLVNTIHEAVLGRDVYAAQQALKEKEQNYKAVES